MGRLLNRGSIAFAFAFSYSSEDILAQQGGCGGPWLEKELTISEVAEKVHRQDPGQAALSNAIKKVND